MNGPAVPCPSWLQQRFKESAGSVPFSQFMAWALHDPEHGAYSTGRLEIGRNGDFCTSPSLSDDFGLLLSKQIVEWFFQLEKVSKNNQLEEA